MIFNRIELIARLKGRMLQRERDAEARYEAEMSKYHEDRREYVTSTTADWSAFADRINERISAGQGIGIDDVPDGIRSYRGIRLWEYKEPRLRRPDNSELQRAVDILEATTSETVSTSALRDLGLRNLFAR